MAKRLTQKQTGGYYTPDPIAASLVRWAVRREDDRMLDPSCGDGRFIAGHGFSVGIEQDGEATRAAVTRAPWALVLEGDFFTWAAETLERFECAAGNPPFIRYQTFKGEARQRALKFCERLGVNFSGLTSSWAPFLVATAGLLKPGGRMAFVVPAEIGHAPYAAPLLEYLLRSFGTVHIVAVREKLFPDLSEDCWLLYVDAYGKSAEEIRFTILDKFKCSARPPRHYVRVAVDEWRNDWKRRLRPFLISQEARDYYRAIHRQSDTVQLGDLADVGIGYVSGANDFFHLRPTEAERLGIPGHLLQPSVRNGRALPPVRLTKSVVDQWRRLDERMLLLRLPKNGELPRSVHNYLDTDAGKEARMAYKCRVREPWYSVPDVQIPDFFLSYMSGLEPSLVSNEAHCSCTNSVHRVRLKAKDGRKRLTVWGSAFVQLSCELEGHPLGGGMLKLEPREATSSQSAVTQGLGTNGRRSLGRRG